MKKKDLIGKIVIYILNGFFIIIMLISLYKIGSYLIGNYKNREIQKTTINTAVKEIEGDGSHKRYEVSFQELKEQNPDTVAYLKVNGTNINYIVVRGEDNSYYLKHNFKKEWNVSGWIFMDYRNKLDGTDQNIVIFGHNTRDGSMFGTLINTLKKEWYEKEDNHIIVLVTEEKTYKYQVFSTYSIVPEDYYIKTSFNNKWEYSRFVQKIKERSIYDYGVEVDRYDKILTLSSCIGEGEKRVVLHAKLLKEDES